MNPYQILGIFPQASEEEIKKAYRKLVSIYHPDIHQNENKNYYEEKMKEINAAYEMAISNLKRNKNTTNNSKTSYQYHTSRNTNNTTQNNYDKTYHQSNQNKNEHYHLSPKDYVAFLEIILYYNNVNNTYNILTKTNESLKNKNYLNRICAALKEYIKRVEPYLKYKNKYFNLSFNEFNILTEYIKKMQNVNASFLNYLKNTTIKVSIEELFPTIKYTEEYSLFGKQIKLDSKIESLLADLNIFVPLFAKDSDILYEANPRCKNYDDKDYLELLASDFYYLTKTEFNFNARTFSGVTTRPHAFDDYVALRKKEENKRQI